MDGLIFEGDAIVSVNLLNFGRALFVRKISVRGASEKRIDPCAERVARGRRMFRSMTYFCQSVFGTVANHSRRSTEKQTLRNDDDDEDDDDNFGRN